MGRGTQAVIIVLVILLAFSAGYFIQPNNKGVPNYEAQLASLEDEIRGLGNQIQGLQSEMTELKETLLPVNQTPQAPALLASDVYEMVKGSVVSIYATAGIKVSQGSGFIVDSKGYLVTNYHVVEGVDEVWATFLDGTSYRAEIIGSDPYSDLAVLSISNGAPLKALALGNSSKLRVGEAIIAIGDPFGLSGSLTTGVVSQRGRSLNAVGGYSIPNVIQIDVILNPGNSGGPLLNYHGEVVGITTAIATETGSFAGVGFAIPSNTIARELRSLIERGTYDHPWLGVQGLDLDAAIADAMGLKVTKGWLITEVVKDGPADKAGLKGGKTTARIDGQTIKIGGDVIIAIDGVSMRNGDDILAYLEEHTSSGQTVAVKVVREGAEITIEVILGARPLP